VSTAQGGGAAYSDADDWVTGGQSAADNQTGTTPSEQAL
jgi:hypothetical protein